MSFSRREFILSAGLLLPASALFSSRKAHAGNRQWRRKWDGQLPLKRLPYDEALELIYDQNLPTTLLPFRRPAAARVHRECKELIVEFKAILKKANGNLGPYMQRIQVIAILVPVGFSALIAWGSADKATREESMLLIRDILKTLST